MIRRFEQGTDSRSVDTLKTTKAILWSALITIHVHVAVLLYAENFKTADICFAIIMSQCASGPLCIDCIDIRSGLILLYLLKNHYQINVNIDL